MIDLKSDLVKARILLSLSIVLQVGFFVSLFAFRQDWLVILNSVSWVMALWGGSFLGWHYASQCCVCYNKVVS